MVKQGLDVPLTKFWLERSQKKKKRKESKCDNFLMIETIHLDLPPLVR